MERTTGPSDWVESTRTWLPFQYCWRSRWNRGSCERYSALIRFFHILIFNHLFWSDRLIDSYLEEGIWKFKIWKWLKMRMNGNDWYIKNRTIQIAPWEYAYAIVTHSNNKFVGRLGTQSLFPPTIDRNILYVVWSDLRSEPSPFIVVNTRIRSACCAG